MRSASARIRWAHMRPLRCLGGHRCRRVGIGGRTTIHCRQSSVVSLLFAVITTTATFGDHSFDLGPGLVRIGHHSFARHAAVLAIGQFSRVRFQRCPTWSRFVHLLRKQSSARAGPAARFCCSSPPSQACQCGSSRSRWLTTAMPAAAINSSIRPTANQPFRRRRGALELCAVCRPGDLSIFRRWSDLRQGIENKGHASDSIKSGGKRGTVALGNPPETNASQDPPCHLRSVRCDAGTGITQRVKSLIIAIIHPNPSRPDRKFRRPVASCRPLPGPGHLHAALAPGSGHTT